MEFVLAGRNIGMSVGVGCLGMAGRDQEVFLCKICWVCAPVSQVVPRGAVGSAGTAGHAKRLLTASLFCACVPPPPRHLYTTRRV
jgi:hypothetical protein